MRNSALFLDRDGVINVDRGYVYRLDQFAVSTGSVLDKRAAAADRRRYQPVRHWPRLFR
jgi:histidinol phosphatase-like enzyme